MPNDRPDVVAVLEKERDYHLDQIKRINAAIAVLKGETAASEAGQPKQRSIGWAATIDKVFEETDEWLSLAEIRQRMAENGVPEAMDEEHRNTIYSTLIRKANKTKTLEKNEGGKYRARQTVEVSTGQNNENKIVLPRVRRVRLDRTPVKQNGEEKEENFDPLAGET